jgi:hypothetical protein
MLILSPYLCLALLIVYTLQVFRSNLSNTCAICSAYCTPLYFFNLIIHPVNSTNNEPYEYSAFSNLLHFLPLRPTYSGTMFSDALKKCPINGRGQTSSS